MSRGKLRVRLVRRPGQAGTQRFVAQYGDRLVCVRYRYDEAACRRYKTIELIVDEQPWEPKESPASISTQPIARPRLAAHTPVGIRLKPKDGELLERLKRTYSWWIPELRVWRLLYGQAVALGITDRIVGTIEELTSER